MAAHGNDTNQALTGLLGNFNVALQDRESDKAEKHRLNNENVKLWNWANNLKRERDSNMIEIKTLSARVVELERILANEGIAIPPPPPALYTASTPSTANLLSPSEIYGDSSNETFHHRRPPTGPRSASDNGGTGRERQSSNRSERERERSGTVTLPASHSINSFTTASSMESSPSYTASSSSRDRDGAPRRPFRAAGASTPPVITSNSSKSLTSQSHNSPFVGGASPGRSREATSASLSHSPVPPLSSSASFSDNINHTSASHGQNSMVGLSPIPITPLINNPDRTASHEGAYTNSPTADAFHLSRDYNSTRSERERERTDSNSVEHLRIAKSSPLPSSPALSSHSASSSFRPSHHSGSQQPSPRSPRFARDMTGAPSSTGSVSPYLEGPTPGSPRHPNFHHTTSQPRLPLNASSVSSLPQQQPSSVPPSSSTTAGKRTVSRKASSLDLGTTDSKPNAGHVISRSATPPPDLGSPKTSNSPVQYAFNPKTPPAHFDSRFANAMTPNNGNRAGMGVAQGTPMMDLPDEARKWILANGSGLPSPVNSLEQRHERDRAAAGLASQVSFVALSFA